VEAISILRPDDLEAVHERAMTILEEIGTDVRHEEALALLRASGQDVDGERVRWDREFVMEMVASAPA
jgi:trimethylamine--corrinoid protein Co-methyltransferase